MRLQTSANALRKVLLLCCGLLGLGVPSMPLVGNDDRPETFNGAIAQIEIGKHVVHRMKARDGCVCSYKEGLDVIAPWRFEKGKYVCIPFGIAVSDGPVPRFASPVAFGQWFKKTCTNQERLGASILLRHECCSLNP